MIGAFRRQSVNSSWIFNESTSTLLLHPVSHILTNKESLRYLYPTNSYYAVMSSILCIFVVMELPTFIRFGCNDTVHLFPHDNYVNNHSILSFDLNL